MRSSRIAKAKWLRWLARAGSILSASVAGIETVKPKVNRLGYVATSVRAEPSESTRTAPTIEGIEWYVTAVRSSPAPSAPGTSRPWST